jgi:hypothetical protein
MWAHCYCTSVLHRLLPARLCAARMARVQLVSETRMVTSPGSRVIVKKLIVTGVVKKFPASNGVQKFIAVFTTARHQFHPEPEESSPHRPEQLTNICFH